MELVAAGKITRTFGKDGEVIVQLYDRFPAKFDIREPLYVRLDGQQVPLFISRFERRGAGGALIVFDDIDSESRCAPLLGQELFLKPGLASAPADSGPRSGPGRFIGYGALIREEGSPREEWTAGTVTAVTGNDANPLFVVESDGREILIPAAEDMIAGADHSGRTVRFVIPAGLLEL